MVETKKARSSSKQVLPSLEKVLMPVRRMLEEVPPTVRANNDDAVLSIAPHLDRHHWRSPAQSLLLSQSLS